MVWDHGVSLSKRNQYYQDGGLDTYGTCEYLEWEHT